MYVVNITFIILYFLIKSIMVILNIYNMKININNYERNIMLVFKKVLVKY